MHKKGVSSAIEFDAAVVNNVTGKYYNHIGQNIGVVALSIICSFTSINPVTVYISRLR